MNAKILTETARALMTDDKGLLAMDESHPTCHKRFAKLGIPQTEEFRRSAPAKGLTSAAEKAVAPVIMWRQRISKMTPQFTVGERKNKTRRA